MIRTKLLLAFTGFIFFSILNWHCTKIDETTLGGGLIPAVDNVHTFDTVINVIGNNVDSVPLGKGCTIIYPTDEHALGYIGNDPLFGTTMASIYTECKPAQFPFYFPAKPADRTLDSIVLILNFRRNYGDTNLQQRVTVHEINLSGPLGFKPDSNSCSSYPFKPAILGAVSYLPARLADSVKVLYDTSANQLRIKLDNAFGLRFLAQDSSATSAFFSDSLARDFFKGFALVPDKIGNALSYFSLTDPATRLAIYYKYKRTGLKDTAVVSEFRVNAAANTAGNIVRDRTNAEINNFSNTKSNPAGDNFLYIQTTPGSYAELKIPGVTGLSNRIIHRAELIIDQAPPTPLDNILTSPPFLFLDMRDSLKGNYHPVPCDFITVNNQPDIGNYGGLRTIVKDASGNSYARYIFNISRYLQKTITNHRAIPILRLSAPDYVKTPASYIDECNQAIAQLLFPLNNIAQGRIKAVGGNATGTGVNRIRLHIIYSTL